MSGLSNALYTSWLGLANHQRRLDVIGNNLANVNTTGYRSEQHQFASILEQSYSAALPSGNGHGSINAREMGLGTVTAAISRSFTNGPIETTNRTLDCAIEGDGFFLVNDNGRDYLTRAGHFYLDSALVDGRSKLLVDRGVALQGYNAVDGAIDLSRPPEDITLPAFGSILAGRATSIVSFTGNLNPELAATDAVGAVTSLVETAGSMVPGEDYAFAVNLFARSDPEATTPPTGETIVPREATLTYAWLGERTAVDGVTPVNAWQWTLTDSATGLALAAAVASFYAEDDATGTHAAGQPLSPLTYTVPATNHYVDTDADGHPLDTPVLVNIDSFTLDHHRMTGGGDDVVADNPYVWRANGSPTGWMAVHSTVYANLDAREYAVVRDDNGYPVLDAAGEQQQAWQSVAATEARLMTLYLQPAEKTVEDGHDYSLWNWQGSLADTTGAVDGGTLRFDANGDFNTVTADGPGLLAYDFTNLRQVATDTTLQLRDQDGYADGSLTSLTIDQNGRIFGHFSNGVAEPLAQFAFANVANPHGLQAMAGTRFCATSASGPLIIGPANQFFAGAGGTGYHSLSLVSGALEGSNVSAEYELTNLILTQRGYQANARSASTADEMLQEIAALKR